MQINTNKIEKLTAKKFNNKVVNKAKEIVSDKKLDLALTSAAVSGAYITVKACKETRKNELGIDSKIFNDLKENYTKNFYESLIYFKQDSKDAFNHIIKNLDKIQDFSYSKTNENSLLINISLSDGYNAGLDIDTKKNKIKKSVYTDIDPDKQTCNVKFEIDTNTLNLTFNHEVKEKTIFKRDNNSADAIASNLLNLGFDKNGAKQLLSIKDNNGNFIIDKNNLYIFEALKTHCKDIFNEAVKNPENISLNFKPKMLKKDFPYGYYEITLNDKQAKVFKDIFGSINTKYNNTTYSDKPFLDITDKYRHEIQNNQNGKISVTEYSDMIPNKLGVLNKSEFYQEIDGNIATSTVVESDGSKRIITSEQDNDKNTISKKYIHFDKHGVINAKTNVDYDYSNPENILITVYDKDYKNNAEETITVIRDSDKDLYDLNTINIEKIQRKYTDQKGKIFTEISTKSDIKNVLNTVLIDETGNKKILSSGKINPDGSIEVAKNFTSIDGTTTDYIYKDAAGIKKMFYRIKDKNGKVLSTIDREFIRISPERAYSSLNGHKWAMIYTEDGIHIEELHTGSSADIFYDDLIAYSSPNKDKLKEMIKNMPADMLIHMYINETPLMFNKNGTFFARDHIEIQHPEELNSFAHELGHGKDYSNQDCNLRYNEEFAKAYETEKAEYIKAFSGAPKTKIEYLISEVGPYQYGESNSGIGETLADINELLSGFLPDYRAEVLQRYFPKTIAAAAKLLNPNTNISL